VGDILTDINNCTSGNCNASTCSALPAVSWVIPDGSWSDHPGPLILNNNQKVYPSVGGPSWVAAIVNAIGVQSVGGTTDCGYWNNTTILITWDDWGGWYDHIAPYLPPNSSYPQVGYPGVTDNNGDWYVYGFRVPLLVVSTYATPGYISGNLNNGQGKTKNPPYIHDFGSILGYVEWAFGLPPYPATSQNTCGIADATGLGCNYPYADYFAPDGKFECPPSACGSSPYPLEDFFSATSHAFTAITGAQYPSSCFTTDVNSCFPYYPADPDDDGIDLQD
jgi:Phosphoesterase family